MKTKTQIGDLSVIYAAQRETLEILRIGRRSLSWVKDKEGVAKLLQEIHEKYMEIKLSTTTKQ
jgi:hypothetical protein